MSTLKIPAILIDLGHVGENGLPVNPAPWFQQELGLCREWGFRLQSSNNRISLKFDQDQLVPYWLQKETPAIAWDWLRVNGYLRLESTNNEALELARKGAPGGTLVFAEEQTAGKGRSGRSWFSNRGKGLCFTIVLRPTQPVHFWPLLTHVASVSLFETIEELCWDGIIPHPLELDLKWPNDVLISGKKCAGILLETTTDAENPAAVVGLGINVRPGSVPESLESVATNLDEMAGATVPRRQFLVRFLQRLQQCYLVFEHGKHGELLERWKSHSSMWNGADVWIADGDAGWNAVTCGLNEIGALMVRTPEGQVKTIFAGDVSVKRVVKE